MWLLQELHPNSQSSIQLTSTQLERFQSQCQRLASNEPLAYVLGHQPFGSLPKSVLCESPTLIPRTETEYWTEWLKSQLSATSDWQPHRTSTPTARRKKVLDLCSGTGCIALSLAHHFPRGVDVLAVDISPQAVSLAERNRRRILPHLPSLSFSFHETAVDAVSSWSNQINSLATDAESSITIIQGDICDNALLAPLTRNCVDLIVSNPPYIDSALHETLPPSVRNFEDRRALVTDNRGLLLIDQILQLSTQLIRPRDLVLSTWPSLCVEYYGNEQTADVRALVHRSGSSALSNSLVVHRDQYSRDRWFTASL
jgi:release factor glutamine methyltransferase